MDIKDHLFTIGKGLQIELLRNRWDSGEATPEEIREVREFLAANEKRSTSIRVRVVGLVLVIAMFATAVMIAYLLKVNLFALMGQ